MAASPSTPTPKLNPEAFDKSIERNYTSAQRKSPSNGFEDPECTFHPKILKGCEFADPDSFYERQLASQHIRDEEILRTRLQLEDEEQTACTFHPRIRQYQKTGDSLANTAASVPNDLPCTLYIDR
jgi:hypothetical protein